ncbi:MAG TPA: hypothetical protein VJH20_00250 [Candidatus Nanoarchaeia archaeon]|nr:hypothetical protein [Candidatus Nanoarchaeia archaeon]
MKKGEITWDEMGIALVALIFLLFILLVVWLFKDKILDMISRIGAGA